MEKISRTSVLSMAIGLAAAGIASPSSTVPIASCGNVYVSVQLVADLTTTAATCLTVGADDVTIDGNGHSISAGKFAVTTNGRSRLTLRNVVTAQDLQLYKSDQNLVEQNQLGNVAIFMGDDNQLRDNTMTALTIQGLNNDPPQRTVVSGNTIKGAREDLVYISPNGDGQSICARSETLFENNVVESSLTSVPTNNGQNLIYLRCGTHNAIVGNTLVSNAKATGIYMRDQADDNLIENNWVWVNESVRAAIHFSSGNVNKHHPRDNVIRNNVFGASRARSIWIQARNFAGNTFVGNLFFSNAPEGSRISGGTGNLFDHNTWASFYRGANLVVLEAFQPPGNTYKSNIFAGNGGSLYQLSGAFAYAGYHGSNNVFFNFTGPALFRGAWSFPQWQAISGSDATSAEMNPEFSDFFFHLSDTSPAKTVGEGGTEAGAYGAP